MRNRVITPEQFEKAVREAVAKYGDEVQDICEAAATKTARATASSLKRQAPTGGRYAKGWSHKKQRKGMTKFSDTVHNRTDYQLTHLLESPHETGGGGHYPKNVDYTGTIAKVEKEYVAKYMAEVMTKI